MTSRNRVQVHSSVCANARIEGEIRSNIQYFEKHPAEIEERLRELDEMWDIERTLETLSSSLSLFGLLMGGAVNRRWLALPVVVQGFFLQHALQGWCPPLPILRRLGVRTVAEIDREIFALRAIREGSGVRAQTESERESARSARGGSLSGEGRGAAPAPTV